MPHHALMTEIQLKLEIVTCDCSKYTLFNENRNFIAMEDYVNHKIFIFATELNLQNDFKNHDCTCNIFDTAILSDIAETWLKINKIFIFIFFCSSSLSSSSRYITSLDYTESCLLL